MRRAHAVLEILMICYSLKIQSDKRNPSPFRPQSFTATIFLFVRNSTLLSIISFITLLIYSFSLVVSLCVHFTSVSIFWDNDNAIVSDCKKYRSKKLHALEGFESRHSQTFFFKGRNC